MEEDEGLFVGLKRWDDERFGISGCLAFLGGLCARHSPGS